MPEGTLVNNDKTTDEIDRFDFEVPTGTENYQIGNQSNDGTLQE